MDGRDHNLNITDSLRNNSEASTSRQASGFDLSRHQVGQNQDVEEDSNKKIGKVSKDVNNNIRKMQNNLLEARNAKQSGNTVYEQSKDKMAGWEEKFQQAGGEYLPRNRISSYETLAHEIIEQHEEVINKRNEIGKITNTIGNHNMIEEMEKVDKWSKRLEGIQGSFDQKIYTEVKEKINSYADYVVRFSDMPQLLKEVIGKLDELHSSMDEWEKRINETINGIQPIFSDITNQSRY